jgi:hypothetical protein
MAFPHLKASDECRIPWLKVMSFCIFSKEYLGHYPMLLPIISAILVPVQSKSIPEMSALVRTTLNSVANSAPFRHCVKRKSTLSMKFTASH